MSPWQIRTATVADAAGVARIQVLGWQQGFAGLLPEAFLAARTVRADLWEQRLAAVPAGFHVGVAVAVEPDGEEVIGFCSVGPVQPGDAEDGLGQLYAIYLLQPWWGHGVGHALHEQGLAALRSAGFAGAVLWVLRDNARTIAFYQREGWRLDGAVRDDPADGAVLRICRMRRPVTVD